MTVTHTPSAQTMGREHQVQSYARASIRTSAVDINVPLQLPVVKKLAEEVAAPQKLRVLPAQEDVTPQCRAPAVTVRLSLMVLATFADLAAPLMPVRILVRSRNVPRPPATFLLAPVHA